MQEDGDSSVQHVRTWRHVKDINGPCNRYVTALRTGRQVVTKRTKNLKKQEIPSLDDPISKLNHIGKETVKKLNELKAAADEADLDLRLPPDLFQCARARSLQ